MAARTLVLLAKLIVLGADDLPSSGQSILFLGRGDDRGIDEPSLLDAVAIYTRDLGLTILRAPDRRPPPTSPSAFDDLATLVRTRGARLAFWCQASADGRSIELVIADGRRNFSRYLFPPEGPAGAELYRAVALKLRAALAGPADVSPPNAPLGPPRGDTDPSGSLSPRSPAGAGIGSGATGAPQPSTRQAPPPAGRSASADLDQSAAGRLPADRAASGPGGAGRGPEASLGLSASARAPYPFFLAVDYALSLPTGSAPWRNGAAVHGIASVHRAVELDLGVELAAAGEQTVAAGSVSVLDVPVRLGARLVRRTRFYLVAVGALAGIHALFAHAAGPDTRTETRRTIAGSFGLEILARGPSVYGFAPEFRIFGEANLPNTRFLVGNQPAYSAGALTVGFGLGVALPAR